MFLTTLKFEYDTITSPNDIHKLIHKVFHFPDEQKKVPVFRIVSESFDGIIVDVYSEQKPIADTYVIESKEFLFNSIELINIQFKYAAVKQKNGKCISYDRKTENAEICTKVRNILNTNGCKVTEISYVHEGIMNDSEHNTKFPYGVVSSNITVIDNDLFKRCLLTGIGRKKYLGLGFINVSKT